MDHVKSLRKLATDAEIRLWYRLRGGQLGYRFRRQHRVEGFIVDFSCFKRRLVIELDGGQHVEQAEYDRRRTLRLNEAGYRVLRFWNDDVLLRTDAVLGEIWRALRQEPPLTPTLSPGEARGEGAKLRKRQTLKLPQSGSLSPGSAGGEGWGEGALLKFKHHKAILPQCPT
ncbi:endonuclease domain-containing protein [Dyella sp. GSA-30]|uniref:endonuclease domain-containing protein n=1 Tax=Dyella sp. GSA-30 TaxID=2994496 RepID=UPI002493C904|nr:endonuclease domain-containing protein [Dyella sp. GSA-30]